VSPPRRARNALACTLGLALALVAFAGAATGAPQPPPTLIAVGDVASCTSDGDERTAALVSRLPGTIAVLGDIVYPVGSENDYVRCFGPSWGPLAPRIRAALGNHEYGTGTAAATIRRFGLPQRGWYSYSLGTWHVVVLNSNCTRVGGCQVGSPQWRWLRADLAAHPSRCMLAYWHHPRFSSGLHGSNAAYQPFWDLLARAKAALVLSGHDHDYERFAPVQGIRQFVVGTGGAEEYPILWAQRRSVVRRTGTFGVLRLTLRPAGYSWRFLAAGSDAFTDAGSAAC
jgi:acid phosphatase type 7